MRRTITTAVLAGAIAAPLGARGVSDTPITGAYVEARTAEVFTGGCIMNSEAAMGGHEALLAWKVNHGARDGVSLDGLSVVAAVVGDTNLGIREIGGEPAHTRSVMFVDERASAEQRTALVAMARQLSNGLIDAIVDVKPAPIQFVDEGGAIRVSASPLRLTVKKHMDHDPTCGGKQWFHPLAAVNDPAMGTTAENAFSGTALGTKWSDPNRRSSFFGTFSY